MLEYEQQKENLGSVADLNARWDEVKALLRSKKAEDYAFKVILLYNLRIYILLIIRCLCDQEDEKNMNSSVKSQKAKIEELKNIIKTEQERNESLTKGKREEIQKKLSDAQQAHKAASERLRTLQAKRPQLEAESQRASNRGRELSHEQDKIKEQIKAADSQLGICDQREQSKLATFGKRLESVKQEIERTQWRGERPLGPFGSYVTLKDTARWGAVMRVMLGQMMSAWAVTNQQDRAMLMRILRKYDK